MGYNYVFCGSMNWITDVFMLYYIKDTAFAKKIEELNEQIISGDYSPREFTIDS